MNDAHVLVVAKAPVPGMVKTRLGRDVGMTVAAELASAALLDTLEACARTFGPQRCHLALTGDLVQAVGTVPIQAMLRGWSVLEQRGESFGAR